MSVETILQDGRERVVLDRQDYEDLIDARDHARGMADIGRAGGLSGAEMADYLAAPTPLAFWRRRASRTQAELAAAAGISQAFLAQIETGRRSGTVGVWMRLAQALDLRLDDLLIAED